MSLKYIRNYYKVEVQHGTRLRLNIKGYEGDYTVLGAQGAYLRVRKDGAEKSIIIHPTWEVEYLSQPQEQVNAATI